MIVQTWRKILEIVNAILEEGAFGSVPYFLFAMIPFRQAQPTLETQMYQKISPGLRTWYLRSVRWWWPTQKLGSTSSPATPPTQNDSTKAKASEVIPLSTHPSLLFKHILWGSHLSDSTEDDLRLSRKKSIVQCTCRGQAVFPISGPCLLLLRSREKKATCTAKPSLLRASVTQE